MSAMAPSREFVHRRRRGAELVLLVLALAVGIGAYAAVGLGIKGEIPANTVGYSVWLAALALAAHIAVRFTAPYADPVLLPVVTALNGLGLAMIYRIDLASKSALSTKQLMWTTLGVTLFAAVLFVIRDHRRLQAFTYTIGLGSVVLLLLPMVPGLGKNINGAQIWIGIGGFSFQPGEIAKLALVIFLAGYLVLHRDALALAGRRVIGIDLPRGRDLGPILVMWLISLLILVFQRDLGSSLLFFGVFLVMLYVATERPGWLFVGSALFAAGATAAYFLFSHVQSRFEGWLDPFSDTDRFSQIVQGLYGMAYGGLVGRGLGLGEPWRISFAYSDFIIASVAEELGLTGMIAVLLLFGLVVERALRTALICRDGFGKLMAAGFGIAFAIQVFVVVGGVTRLIPLTGLTTPFMSYGGSSLIANWVMVGLLLRISDHARRPAPVLSPMTQDDATEVVVLR